MTIIIVTILGNSLVLVSIALNKQLHTVTNWLIVSLAVADIMVALCVMPIRFVDRGRRRRTEKGVMPIRFVVAVGVRKGASEALDDKTCVGLENN